MTWKSRYYHYDGLGSTLCLTDENGEITDSYAYTAFGEELDTGAANPTRNPFRYVGQQGYYRDADTGDYYVRARVYRPVLARWLSEDPLLIARPELEPQTTFDYGAAPRSQGDERQSSQVIAYEYARNRPTTYLDPSGLIDCLGDCADYVFQKCWWRCKGVIIIQPFHGLDFGGWFREARDKAQRTADGLAPGALTIQQHRDPTLPRLGPPNAVGWLRLRSVCWGQ